MNNLRLETSITIDAPAAKVWQGITDPNLVEQYFFGTKLESTWEVGSLILFHGDWEGKPYEDKGIIQKIEPEKYLEYSYWSNWSGLPDSPENYNTITYALDEKEGKTTVTVSQAGIKNEEAKKDSEKNWQLVLAGLRKLMEKDGK